MFGNFTEECKIILIKAKVEMSNLNHPYIGSEHLMLSILNNDNELKERLETYDLNYSRLRKEIIKIIGIGKKKSELYLYTPLLKKIIQNAILDSKDNNNGIVTTNHLFMALLEEGEGIAIRIMLGMGINLDNIYDDFSFKLIKTKGKDTKLLINKLGEDITEKAKNKEIDPVIGREQETKRIIEILGRRNKNNPILVGKAGVGKTAIVEELSRCIIEDNVPEKLKNKRIISLDMASVVAGTKYRGEFEEKLIKIIEELESNQDIILFIDEVHTLVGAGGAEGAIDASNIFKPALARGKIKCIGATTEEEYKKYIENDKALDRRFQKVYIEEPSKETTKKILMKLKPIYESFHNVKLSNEIIDKIIELSDKYIHTTNRPDRAIDVLDEVCSRVNIIDSKENDNKKIAIRELQDIIKRKEKCIKDNDLDQALELRKKESYLNSILKKIEQIPNNKRKEVTLKDISYIINSKTKIPVYEIEGDNEKIIEKIQSMLSKEIIGQEKAISSLVNITKRVKLGYTNNKVFSMLFAGPTGVGKTQLSKLFGNTIVGEKNFIRIDMSEYNDSTAINKLLGSSPGYIGYNDNNNILEKVRSNPNSVLLLDEIDKAHRTVLNILYQILDEGYIRDSNGRDILFNNTIIIMTTNIGFEKSNIGFNKIDNKDIERKIKDYFNIALFNRIDEIILFNRLTEEDITKIIKKELQKTKEKYKNIKIKIDNKIIKEIIELSNYKELGARTINKIITSKIESEIIDNIINNSNEIEIKKIISAI